MLFDIKKPCGGCPFLKENNLRLSKKKKQKFVNDIVKKEYAFVCHRSTKDYSGKSGKENHCAGALIIMEKNQINTRVLRIAIALGGYDPALLKMDSPVFDNFNDFIEAHNVPTTS